MRSFSQGLPLLLLLTLWTAGQVPDRIKNAPGRKAYPDADGIVLLQEVEIILDKEGKVTRRHLTLTRILREYMMRSGRCDPHISYDSTRQDFTGLRCRTWMRDGKAVDTDPGAGFVKMTPFALEHAVDYTGLRQVVMIHTGVEHGATNELEYRIVDRIPPGHPFWGEIPLQSDMPILELSIVFRVPEGTPLVIEGLNCALNPVKKTADGVDVYTIERKDHPAVNLEECGKGKRDVLARLIYSTVPSWAEVGTLLDRWVNRSIDGSDGIKQRVRSLTEGVGTTLARAYRIHDFVAARVRNVSWPIEDFGFKPRPASRIHESAYGHPLDKAVLLKAMLKEAGIPSSVVLASRNRTRAMRAASPTQLQDVWVVVDHGTQRVWFDPTAPLSNRSGQHLEGHAVLKLAGRGSTWERVSVSDPASNLAVMTGRCTVGADQKVAAEIQLDLAGNLNPYHRLRNGDGPLRSYCSRVASTFGGAHLEKYDIYQFGDMLSSFALKVSGGAVSGQDRESLEIPLPELPDFLAGRDYQIYRNRRSTPLFLAGVAKEITEVVIHLPAGYTIVYIPRAVILDSPVGSLHLSLIQEGGKVVYKKTFTVKKSVVTPEEYADFRKLITAQRVRRNTVILLQRTEG